MKKRLGRLDLVCLGLNCVVGSGIFLTAGDIAFHLQGWALPAIGLATLLCLAIAVCFAEMAATVPGTGGAYLYCSEAFGPRAGFMVGWVMWLSGLLGGASVAVGFGDYLNGLGLPSSALSLALVLVLTVCNYFGARLGAFSNDLLAALKLAPLVLFAVWALAQTRWSEITRPATGETDLLLGFLLILYAFSGFEWLSVPAGESQNPQRDVLVALVSVLLLAGLLYFTLLAGVLSLGLAGAEAALAKAASPLAWLSVLVAFAGVVSIASVNAAIAFTSPRSLWALAHDGWLPTWLAYRDEQTASPTRSVIVNGGLTLLLVAFEDFEALASFTVLISLLQYLATILALMWLRYRQPERIRPYRVPGGLVVPLLALMVCLVLLVTTSLSLLAEMGVALGFGWALSWLGIRREPGPDEGT